MRIESVFISYTAVDFPIASAINDTIANEGLDVWFAPRDFRAGNRFDEIMREIEARDALVALLSKPAIESPWVRKEINLAMMHQLGGHPQVIIPCYLDTAERLFDISDIKPINLQRTDLESGIRQIIDTLLDKDSDPTLHTFASFCDSLITIPGLTDTGRWNAQYEADRVAEGKDADEAADDVLRNIEVFAKRALAVESQQRIRNAVREQATLPILPGSWAPFVRQFARQADAILLRFAEDLPQLCGTSGVTRGPLTEWCRDVLAETYPEVAEEITQWQTTVVIDQAQRLGLLDPSQENLRGPEDAVEFIRNPSYDAGPLAQMMSRLVADFRRRRAA